MSDAIARAHTWALWSRLVLDGPTDDLVETAAQLPALAAVLPAGDADARAAAHFRALSRDVLPWESVFLSADGLLGGPVAESVRRDTEGLRPDRADVEPDHLGLELAVLSRLSLAEAHDQPGAPQAAAAFLDRHLLRWLPPLVLAARGGDPFWSTIVEMALELGAAHRASMPGRMAPFALPDLPDLLDDPKTGLKRIAETWTRPALTGVFLGVRDLAAVAAEAGVPAGFDSRTRQLEALLFGTSDHGRLGRLLDALDRRLAGAQDAYRELGALGVETGPWIARTGETRATLERLRAAV